MFDQVEVKDINKASPSILEEEKGDPGGGQGHISLELN